MLRQVTLIRITKINLEYSIILQRRLLLCRLHFGSFAPRKLWVNIEQTVLSRDEYLENLFREQ